MGRSAKTRADLPRTLAEIPEQLRQESEDLRRDTLDRAHCEGPGQGAEFTACLPLAPALAPPAGPVASPAPAGKPYRILLIEDNVDVAESMQALLRLAGHQVEVAYTGPSGIEMARSFWPEVVLCDIGLPGGMDGYSVARILRQDPGLASAHLLALTGFARDEDQHRATEAGFDLYLTKPVNLQELQSVLASLGPRHGDGSGG